MPWLFAFIEQVALPPTLSPFDVADDEDPDEVDATVAVWRGLHAKGILIGRFDHPAYPHPRLEVHRAPVPWLLGPPSVATAYGRRYAVLYPGVWPKIGIPEAAFDSPQAWLQWCIS